MIEPELKTSLPYFLKLADDAIDEVSIIRNEVIEKLKKAVLDTNFDINNDPARTTEVKLGSINTLDSLLTSKEKVRLNRAKLAMQDKTNDILQDVGKDITTILPQVGLETLLQGLFSRSKEETDAEIEQVFKKSGLSISAAELENDPTKLD